MTQTRSLEPIARPSALLAMAIVVCSSVGWNVIANSGPRLPLIALGLAFLAASTLGWVAYERREPQIRALWIAALTVLACAALWTTTLGVFLIAMPVIGLAALYFGIRGGILVTAVFLACAVAILVDVGVTPVQIYTGSTGFLPGAVFVVVVARLVIRERDARQQLRLYAAQVEELAITGERNRIAREIHDSVGHFLTVVHVQIEAARAIVGSDPDAANQCLDRAQELARDGLTELRRSVTLLRGGAAEDRPFGVALAALVDDCDNHGLDATLSLGGTPRPLAPAVEFALFRAAQEAITNTIRHARARELRCTLRYDAREVSLRVEDDGIGAITTEGGFGLVGLRERVTLVGGTATLDTSPGHGFAVEIRVPV